MKIQQGSALIQDKYWTVLVDQYELQCDIRALPYSTWIGVVRENGVIDIWTPAASVPRGYRRAAQVMLEKARDKLVEDGLVKLRRR